MTLINLTKRNYIGQGYFNVFKDADGNKKYVEITEDEYVNLGNSIPILDGYTWDSSLGGAMKTDSPNYLLAENEYCLSPDGCHCILKNWMGVIRDRVIDSNLITNDQIDDSNLYIWD